MHDEDPFVHAGLGSSGELGHQTPTRPHSAYKSTIMEDWLKILPLESVTHGDIDDANGTSNKRSGNIPIARPSFSQLP